MRSHGIYRRWGITILLLLVTIPVSAQSGRLRQGTQPQKQEKKASALPPVVIVNNPSPEYRSGEVSIAVRGNENPIIRLGLAQNAVTLVEFPASDRFFAVNPGNTDLVTIEDSPTKETDHFFVIRPASGFLPPAEGTKVSAPATSIIVQMSSGMVVTFLLYPVKDIEQNAHRCVVTYDREAIIKARQAANLAINLDRREETTAVKPLPQSRRITPVEPPPPPPVSSNGNEEKPEKEEEPALPPPIDPKFPGSNESWSRRLHGLKVAVRERVVDANQRQVLVAVRNVLPKHVQIAPGYPELYIHTLKDKGRVLQTDTVKNVKIECDSPNGLIKPGEALRYRITYQPPVLGAKQRLGVAVAQTNAADDPVMVELAPNTR